MLCVVFKSKPTFHKITTGPDSELLLNGKKFGSCSTVAALVKQLSTKQKNWPVPLINPVPKPADGSSTEAAGPVAKKLSIVAETPEEPVEDELAEAQRLEDERIAAEAAAQQKRDAEEQARSATAAAAEAEAQETKRQKQQEEGRKAKEAEADRKAHAKLITGLGNKVTSIYANPDAPADPLSELDAAIVLSQEDFDAVVATVDHFADGTGIITKAAAWTEFSAAYPGDTSISKYETTMSLSKSCRARRFVNRCWAVHAPPSNVNPPRSSRLF